MQNFGQKPSHICCFDFFLLYMLDKIRRGPKLEGCAFANFGNSSGTEGEATEVKEKREREKKIGGKKNRPRPGIEPGRGPCDNCSNRFLSPLRQLWLKKTKRGI